ncbi:ATP-binding cassette domain-containing protein [Weissella coleopterorum]|uniref:ATP-binding cassette domain-containing protein n=1 Tax=Weissella coleopterorum TaxID=2714949 RepID=A0A6G8AZ25_9LACO|nr:ATP-binding cassette domain-containing protein [Weissella coleopterorum]
MSLIELSHINVDFKQAPGSVPAVFDVSLKINRGSIFGIVGYSGAGKSTLVRTINLLQRPTEGSVKVNDVEMTNLSPQELRLKRQKIGMIFQHFNLLDEMTVQQNILQPLKHSTQSQTQKHAKVQQLLDLVGLTAQAQNYPHQLSGGQKQRVAIARALANDPDILISDEATSALDPKTTQQILELLNHLNQTLGLTILIITHEMQVIEALADQVAIMEKGQIIETGSVANVFQHPKQKLTQEFITLAQGFSISKLQRTP